MSCSEREDPVEDNSFSPNSCNDAAQIDIYRDLILRHLIQDINSTCIKLAVPTSS